MSAQTLTNGKSMTATAPAQPAAAPSFGEAPASATVDAISPSGRRWLLTTRAATVGELMQRVEYLDKWLSDHDWTARPAPASQAQVTGQPEEPTAICDTCGRPMKQKPRRDGKGMFWSCETRYGSEWCKGKPKK